MTGIIVHDSHVHCQYKECPLTILQEAEKHVMYHTSLYPTGKRHDLVGGKMQDSILHIIQLPANNIGRESSICTLTIRIFVGCPRVV